MKNDKGRRHSAPATRDISALHDNKQRGVNTRPQLRYGRDCSRCSRLLTSCDHHLCRFCRRRLWRLHVEGVSHLHDFELACCVEERAA